jgi:DNA-binding CsgD family transcriptional regulator
MQASTNITQQAAGVQPSTGPQISCNTGPSRCMEPPSDSAPQERGIGQRKPRLRRGKSTTAPRLDKVTPSLSARQRCILEYLLAGKQNKEIGVLLKVSEQVVKNDLHEVFTYFGIHHTRELFPIMDRVRQEAGQR